MPAIPFQVEFVAAERGYLIARQLAPRPFRLVEGSQLDGCPLEPRHLEVPRASNPDGTPRTDLFAFLLRRREQAARFKPGDRVELTGWREQGAPPGAG